MKINDIIEIKNKCGILKIKIKQQLNILDINRGIYPFDKFEGSPRLELHKNRNQFLVTLTGKYDDKNIILVFINKEFDTVCYWGEILNSEIEDDRYETIY